MAALGSARTCRNVANECTPGSATGNSMAWRGCRGKAVEGARRSSSWHFKCSYDTKQGVPLPFIVFELLRVLEGPQGGHTSPLPQVLGICRLDILKRRGGA